jgi:hypothetical protein
LRLASRKTVVGLRGLKVVERETMEAKEMWGNDRPVKP